MQQMRKHRRHKLPLRVEISHKSIGTLLLEANDMSEGGVLLILDGCFQLDVGEIVSVRSAGLGVDGNETGPVLDMRATGVIAPLQTIASSNQCAANKDSLTSCAEFLIPCRVHNSGAENEAGHPSFRWTALDNLTQQNLCFDRRSVDILRSRV